MNQHFKMKIYLNIDFNEDGHEKNICGLSRSLTDWKLILYNFYEKNLKSVTFNKFQAGDCLRILHLDSSMLLSYDDKNGNEISKLLNIFLYDV